MDRANIAPSPPADSVPSVPVWTDGVRVVLAIDPPGTAVALEPHRARALAQALIEAARNAQARTRGGAR